MVRRWFYRSSKRKGASKGANDPHVEEPAVESTPLIVTSAFEEENPTVTKELTTYVVSHHEDNKNNSEKQNYSNGSTHTQNRSRLWIISQSFRQLSMRITDAVLEHTGSIGYLGSYAIAVNSLTGPAMLELPATYAECGFIPTTITLIFVCFLSAFCSLHMANSISKIRSTREADDEEDNSNRISYNHDFKSEVEFSAAFSYYWGRRPWFFVTHFLFWACITCLNISSIVDTSQVVDTILGHTFGTAALQIGLGQGSETKLVFWNSLYCVQEELELGLCLPFAAILHEENSILMTMGTLATTLFFLPLALNDLKENAFWQILAFLVLLLTSFQFIVQFAFIMDLSYGPSVGTTSNEIAASFDSRLDANQNTVHGWNSEEFLWGYKWENLFGVVLFNYALVIAVPAWLYERQSHVDVPTVIYGSSFMSTFLYIAIGCLGRLAMPHVSSNMLASLMSGASGLLIQLGASVFAFFIVGLGIPLFSVWTRLNLIAPSGEHQQPLCSRFVGNIWAVYFPFGVSWFLYNGKAITKLLSWGGILFTSFVAFILPLSLALFVVRNSSAPGSVAVYGFFSLDSKRAQEHALIGLLGLAIVSIIAAIAGDVMSAAPQ
ncbi:hypothetical protein ACA910_004878 [Epithemia clementina (nom. ined.)]